MAETESKNYSITRREALHRLAMFPFLTLQLDPSGGVHHAIEDILPQCAAGITACWHLIKGTHEEMELASRAASAYVPTLKAVVEQSSTHRKDAANLAAQALLLKATLGVHKESLKHAVMYAEQASIYGKETKDVSLMLTILKRSAWILACSRQIDCASEKVLEAEYLLRQAKVPVSPQVQSNIYGGVAKYQAQNGCKEEAFMALRNAHQIFHRQGSEDEGYTESNLSTLIMDDGLTHYHTGQYSKALDSFAQAIDLETLMPKIPPASERTRYEIINFATLASLKQPKKDMEHSIKLWTAGIQGAITLQSDQRYNEAVMAYEIMQALWPDERNVKDLRGQIVHW